MDLAPSQYARHRQEPPFTSSTDANMWQYAERPIAAGEELETTLWPHASMIPLNESARRILEFFKSHQKSRMPQSRGAPAGYSSKTAFRERFHRSVWLAAAPSPRSRRRSAPLLGDA
jgi:hypothetical protein